MACDIGHPSWMTFLTSAPTIRERNRRSAIKANFGNELILTTASNVQKYRIWPVLPQFKDLWIRRQLGDPELCEPEPPNARIREGLNAKHNVTRCPSPVWVLSDQRGNMTAYLVCIRLNLDNTLPQLLGILDARFKLEERFFLRT